MPYDASIMQFLYPGDHGGRVVWWLKRHLRAIECCVAFELPEASLTLLYSGIDTLGWLRASANTKDASRSSFISWCENYILPRLRTVDGKQLTALDLYAARCGVLHTSNPVSKHGREGEAHEVWYQFRGQAGLNLMANAPLPPMMLDIEQFAVAFREGGVAFIAELNQDQTLFKTAEERAGKFFRWGTVR